MTSKDVQDVITLGKEKKRKEDDKSFVMQGFQKCNKKVKVEGLLHLISRKFPQWAIFTHEKFILLWSPISKLKMCVFSITKF